MRRYLGILVLAAVTLAVNMWAAAQPSVVSVTRASANPVNTGTTSVNYRVLFSQPVQNVDGGDFAVTQVSGNPSASVTGVSGPSANLNTDFGALPSGGSLVGNATLTGGYCSLTSGASQSGTFVWNPGGLVQAFRAEFDLYIGDGSGADGFGFAYGANAAGGVGEEGAAGAGMEVCFDTYENGGEGTPNILIRSNDVQVGTTVGRTLRTSSFVRVIIDVTYNGSAYTCSVYHNGAWILTNVTLTGYAPDASWRFGLGARTGGAWDNHRIDNLSIRGSDRTVTLGNLNGNGNLRLDLGNPTIQNLDGTAINPATYTSGEQYTFNLTSAAANPSITSIARLNASPVIPPATSAAYRVTFSEPVQNLDSGDFQLTQVNGNPTATLNVPTIPTLSYSEAFTSGPGSGTLLGNATVSGGVLHLTENSNGQNGVWTYDPGQALTSFRATFRLRIGGGDGADGFAFAYGVNAGAIFGQEGPTGNGLTVAFDTYENAGDGSPNITVKYNGVDLLARPKTLRTNDYRTVTVSVTPGGLCTVIHDGTITHRNVVLPGWAPQATWRIGLGAATGGLNDYHYVDDFVLQNNLYDVTLTSPAGQGDIRLDAVNATIQDFEGITISPNSVNGEVYRFDFVLPTPTISFSGFQPSNVSPVVFNIACGEPVYGAPLAESDFNITNGTFTSTSFTDGNSSFTVTVTPSSPTTTVSLQMKAGVVNDVNGNANPISNTQNVAVDTQAPTADSITTATVSPTNSTTVDYTVVFSENVSNFDAAADLQISETGISHTGLTITPISGSSYTVRFTGLSGSGTLQLSVRTSSDVRDGANNALASSVTSAPLSVDTVAPQCTSITGPSGVVSAVSFNVQFSESVLGFGASSDLVITASGVSYSGVSFSGSAEAYTVTFLGLSGMGTIRLAASTTSDIRDAAGNGLSSSVTSTDVQVDATPPTAGPITYSGPNPTVASSVQFSVQFSEPVVNVNDAADMVVTVTPAPSRTLTYAGVTVTPVDAQNFTVSVNGLSGEGTIQLAVSTTSDVRDVAGNALASSTSSPVVQVDNRGPRATVTAVTPTPTRSSTVIFSVVFDETTLGFDAASDLVITASGLSYSSLAFSGSGTTYQVTFGSVSGTGSLSLAVSTTSNVRDSLGNACAFSTVGGPVQVDNTAPSVTVNTLTTNDTTPTVSGTVSDNVGVASVSVVVNGQTYAATLGSGTWTANVTATLADGVYDVAATATDTVGNTRADSTTNELRIDTVQPSITVNTLTTSDTTPTVSGTVSDNVGVASVSVVVNGQTYTGAVIGGTWTANVTATLADGVYEVAATATDTAGNTRSDATTNELTVDSTPPVVTVTSQTTSDRTPLVAGTVSDNLGVASVSVVVNGQTYAATVASGNWSAQVTQTLPDGTYNVAATATDTAGNPGVDSTTDELIIDANVPSVTVNALATTDTTPQVSGTVAPPVGYSIAGVDVTVNGQTYAAVVVGGTWTATVTTALPDGVYDVQAVATDNHVPPRSGTDGTTNELRVDTTGPTVLIERLDPAVTDLDAVRFQLTFNEPVTPTFGLSDVSVTGGLSGTAALTQSADPVYVVTVTASDAEDDGTVGIALTGSVTDDLGNAYTGSDTSEYTINNWHGFTQQPVGADIYAGDGHTFTLAAEYGNSTPSYQWKLDDGQKAVYDVGGNTPFLSIANATTANAGDYWCEVTYAGQTYTSATVTLTVSAHVTFTQQPVGGEKVPGDDYTFTSATTGGIGTVEYQWYRNGQPISGATDTSYTVTNIGLEDAGVYYVMASDEGTDSVQSAEAVLSVPDVLPAAGGAALAALTAALGALASRRLRRRS